MLWTVALCVFLAQLGCCIYGKGWLRKYLPTLIAAGALAVTWLSGGLGIFGAVLLAAEGLSVLMGLLAIVLYRIVLWTKK